MENYTVHQLLDRSRDEALERWCDGRNAGPVRLGFFGFAIATLVLALVGWSGGRWLFGATAGLGLAALLAAFFLQRQPRFSDWFRTLVVVLVPLELALLIALSSEPGFAVLAFLVLPFFLVRLRLRPSETALIAALALGAIGLRVFLDSPSADGESLTGPAIGALFVNLLAAAAGVAINRRLRQRFLAEFRLAQGREHERSRMRGEIDDARKVQLALLPAELPRLDWLEIEGLSLPASEVGGDYYDFLPLPDGRLAVVVGDVAGHGLAAGMLLAGVRSCLHLLRDELGAPVEVLGRIDRVVRDSGLRRMFMTLLIAVLDPHARTLTVANAGHPPGLLRRAGGEIERQGDPAPPLGTRLAPAYTARTVAFEPGELLVLHTDGLTETGNARGGSFGEQRLIRRLAASSDEASAREVQQSLLGDLALFKGDAVQEDDVTLIVLRRLAVS